MQANLQAGRALAYQCWRPAQVGGSPNLGWLSRVKRYAASNHCGSKLISLASQKAENLTSDSYENRV